jgi:hypothetical protein
VVEDRRRLAPRIRHLTALLFLLVLPLASFAQPVDTMLPAAENAETPEPADRRLYFAMWTIHFRDLDRGLDNNWLLAMSWGRMYGATFVNSFGRRAYSIGVQQSIARWKAGIVSARLGYRAGLVTGYDERLFPLAGTTPVLPLLQPLVTLDVNRLGLELSYSGVIASTGWSIRL